MVTVKGYVDRVVIVAARPGHRDARAIALGEHDGPRADSITWRRWTASPARWTTRRSSATGSSPRASPSSAPSWSAHHGADGRLAPVRAGLATARRAPAEARESSHRSLPARAPLQRRGRHPADAVAGGDRGRDAAASRRCRPTPPRPPRSTSRARPEPLQPAPGRPRRRGPRQCVLRLNRSRHRTPEPERNPPMADVTIELLKTHLRQLRLPTMGREFEKLARDAAATNQTFAQFLLRLTEIELAARVGQRGGDADQERGVPGREGLRHLRLQRHAAACPSRRSWSWRVANGSNRNPTVAWSGATEPGRLICRSDLGLAACRAGLRVRFFTAAALVSQLEKEQKQYTLDRFLRPARPGAPADLRRAGLRDDEPRRGRAAVPGVRRPLRARQHPGDEQPAVQRVEPDLPGGADDRGAAGPADATTATSSR